MSVVNKAEPQGVPLVSLSDVSFVSQGIVGAIAGITLLASYKFMNAGFKGQPELLVYAAIAGVVGMAIAGLVYFLLCKPCRLELYSNGVLIEQGSVPEFLPCDEITEFTTKEYDLHLNMVYNNTLYWLKFTDSSGRVHRYNCNAMYGSEKQKSVQRLCEFMKSTQV